MGSLVSFARRAADANVLVVTNMWPEPGNDGFGIFVRRQVGSLVARGLRCDVMVVHGRSSLLAYGIAAAQLARLSAGNEGSYRLVHAHGGESAVPARFYLRAPLVVSYCGSDLLGARDDRGVVSIPWRLRRTALREHSRLARATITKTEELERRLPDPVRARNSVIPNGVDRTLFAPMARTEARAALGWDGEKPVVLFAADPRLASKRVDLAQAACAAARRRGWDCRLHIAHGVPPDRMPLLMNAADCLLLTSAAEGSPNVVKEALACNLPVVSTPVGDVRALLQDVSPSAVAAPEPDALASALIDCTRDGDRSNGRQLTGWLDEGNIAERILDLYRQLVPDVA
jgi:teichuronic acid biosynthesis glycosyltransferase TuaC